MRLDLMHEFLIFSKCLNYSKAAEQLYLTQPVLSRHIIDLEKEVGVQLVVRNTRNVKLTEMGRIFAENSKQILEKYEDMIEHLHSATNGVSGRLSIGFLHFAVKDFLSQFTLYFSNLYPKIRIEFYADEIHALIDKIETNELDICFTTSNFNTDSTIYRKVPILQDKLCILLPINHSLCDKDKIYISDLSSQPIVEFSKTNNPWTYAHHQNIFKSHNAEYNIAIEAPNIYTALFYVSINKGILIIPEHLASLKNDNTVQKRILDEDAGIDINLICKKNNKNPIIELFFNSLENYIN